MDQSPETSIQSNFQERRILIIDDNPTNLGVLSEYLEEYGFTIFIAQDGESGLEKAHYSQPDLILLDVLMPGIDGFETCRRLKADEITREIPVIFVTALVTVEEKVKGFEAGAADYLTKPLHQKEVLARVTTHLRLRDLTRELQQELVERKRAEEKLRQMTTDLARSNTELEQFAYIASHDLQEPLRAVAGTVQILQRRYAGQLDARADKLIQHAVEGVSRMQTLIHDLLALSRVGRRGEPFKPIDGAAVLADTLANLTVAIRESGAVITHDPLPTVLADRTQLTQLFQNLIGNAIKFRGDRAPAIHIGVEQKESEWLLSVRDNGIGLEVQYFERIFAMFQRLHTREEYPGTGIGLAICKKIVERHGGHIWVESQPGQGTVFYFTLPIVPAILILKTNWNRD